MCSHTVAKKKCAWAACLADCVTWCYDAKLYFQVESKSESRSLHWTSPACIKERLSTSAHTSQSPTESWQYLKIVRVAAILRLFVLFMNYLWLAETSQQPSAR